MPASLVEPVDAELSRLGETDGSLPSFSSFDSKAELELEEILEDKVRLESRSMLGFWSASGLVFLSAFSSCLESLDSSTKID